MFTFAKMPREFFIVNVSYLEPRPLLKPPTIDFRLDIAELADDCRVRGVKEPFIPPKGEFDKDVSITVQYNKQMSNN